MLHIRSITTAALATGLVIFASSSVLANSEINETREARRAYCLNDVEDFNKGRCMKMTAQSIQRFQAEYRACMSNPKNSKSVCDEELSAKLNDLPTSSD